MDALPPCNGRWPAMASPPFTAKRRDLNSEVPSEEGARRIPGRAPEHPVDDPKSDERRTRTARDRERSHGRRDHRRLP